MSGYTIGGGASDGNTLFPLSHWGLVAATGDPHDFNANSPYDNGLIFYSRMWIPKGTAITNLWLAVSTAAATHDASTPNKIGLWDDDGVFVDATANDPTMFSTAGWGGGPLAGGPIAGQGVGRWVYLGALTRGWTTAPGGAYPSSAADRAFHNLGPGTTKRRAFFTVSNLTLPASINPASSGTASGFIPLYAAS